MKIADILKFKDGRKVDVSWPIRLLDDNGNETYCEDSDGYWWKSKYDDNGNETYCEDSDGYWRKSEYDDNGNETYFEDADGHKRGTPRKQTVTIIVEGRSIEISRESAVALGLVKG